LELFEKVYRFRGMAGDEFSKLFGRRFASSGVMNYSSIAIQTAMAEGDNIRRLQDSVSMDSVAAPRLKAKIEERLAAATRLMRKSETILPDEWRTPYFGAQMYAGIGRTAQADSILDAAVKRMPKGAHAPARPGGSPPAQRTQGTGDQAAGLGGEGLAQRRRSPAGPGDDPRRRRSRRGGPQGRRERRQAQPRRPAHAIDRRDAPVPRPGAAGPFPSRV
jgi:hypothetical protein